jgi:hypothetical protein
MRPSVSPWTLLSRHRLRGTAHCAHSAGSYYFFIVVVIITYKPTAAARWALLLIVRAFFNDTITIAVGTGFHV